MDHSFRLFFHLKKKTESIVIVSAVACGDSLFENVSMLSLAQLCCALSEKWEDKKDKHMQLVKTVRI